MVEFKRIEGVSERLLKCAKEEFLEKGFLNASVRAIAAKANSSTRAIYTRFKDKEGIFSALVEPVYKEYLALLESGLRQEWVHYDGDSHGENTGISYIDSIVFAYRYFDEFKLLLCASNGTVYSDFIEKIVSMNEGLLFENLSEQIQKSGETDKLLLHMVTRAFYDGLFEPIRHGMSKEEAIHYTHKLTDVFMNGVYSLWK